MALPLNKKVDLPLYYQCALAIGAVFIFFTNLDSYLYGLGITPTPLLLSIAFGIASTPLLFSFFSRIKYIPVSVITACAIYIAISLISFLSFLSSTSALLQLRIRCSSVFFLVIMVLIFSRYSIVQTWARRAIMIAVLMAVFINIHEFLNPSFNELNTSGRPAGFYINPNQSGCALVLGMIFSLGMLQPRYRMLFVLITGLGVFITFSRGAILGWLVVTLIFIVTRVIHRSQLLYWVIGLGITIVLAGSALGNLLDLDRLKALGLLNENISGRLEWFESPLSSEDSAASRLEVAKMGWQMFAEHPFWGNGIGSTLELGFGASTHNTYLYYMADHGILGAFFLPLLVYAVTWHARGESKYVGFAFAAFILLWGLFSHNIFEERYTLMMFSLMAAMNATSQLEQRSQAG